MRRSLAAIGPYLLLSAVCALVYIPGQASLPLTDRDEARFVQATRQMIDSGDYVVVRFQDQLRAKKPAGVYWLQAVSVRMLSDAQSMRLWPYRLPSLIAAIASVLCTFFFAARLFDRRIAWLASLGLASSLLVGVEAHLATTDATLLLWTTVSQGCLALVYLQARSGRSTSSWSPAIFWIATGASILTKGPVGPAISALTIASLCIADREVRWLRALHPLPGILAVVLIVAPWMWLVSHETGGLFLTRAISEDLLPKLVSGHEGHGAPPGFYAIALAITLWPISAFAWPSVFRAWALKANPALRFALAWALPGWLMFELLPTKLPHYTLPLHPAFAIIVAAALATPRSAAPGFVSKWLTRVWFLIWGVLTGALAAIVLWLPIKFGPGLATAPAVIAAGAILLVPIVVWMWRRSRPARALLAIATAGAVAQVALIAGVVPTLSTLWLSDQLVAARNQWDPQARLLAVAYQEPSLVFLGGSETAFVDAQQAALSISRGERVAVIVDEATRAALLSRLPSSVQMVERAMVQGFNYSRGREQRLYVLSPLFTRTPPPAGSPVQAAPDEPSDRKS